MSSLLLAIPGSRRYNSYRRMSDGVSKRHKDKASDPIANFGTKLLRLSDQKHPCPPIVVLGLDFSDLKASSMAGVH